MKRADGGLGRRDTAGVLSGQLAVGGSPQGSCCGAWVQTGASRLSRLPKASKRDLTTVLLGGSLSPGPDCG